MEFSKYDKARDITHREIKIAMRCMHALRKHGLRCVWASNTYPLSGLRVHPVDFVIENRISVLVRLYGVRTSDRWFMDAYPHALVINGVQSLLDALPGIRARLPLPLAPDAWRISK